MKKYSKVTLPAGIIIVKRLTPSTRLATINDDDNRNGENCLKAIYGTSTKLEFAYDYNGRRFNKKVYAKSGGNWVLSRESLFVYDNFKQIAEFTVSGSAKTLAKSYAWQPEASGDFDVPLWQKVGGNVYTCVVDGNKNVRRLLNTAGTEVANYDYDPFGGVTASGTASAGNPFRFSSEFLDEETGLVYYNYRYYSPALGRWISRDPSGEQGGVNLYAVIGNIITKFFDRLGLVGCCGKDVTDQLLRLFKNIRKALHISVTLKDAVCSVSNLYDPEWGWDIIEFYKAGGNDLAATYSGDPFRCTSTRHPVCNRTVGYKGGCYKVWAINYALWGNMNRYCGISRIQALKAVSTYRGIAYDPSEGETKEEGSLSRAAWAAAGYDSFAITPPPTMAKYSRCQKCPDSYKGELHVRLRYDVGRHFLISSKDGDSGSVVATPMLPPRRGFGR
ncbi:RHS repeat-associated core domain-containing protein [Victivallis sp. Marseille-Q1083]|uniref:RHS repeat-associated core domain-containing protein n=1 Tax=Victivallis sp. Marseille-Q1083 TaxID=2717288 RepID=UPI00158F5AFF|nr:RHS repeat-associated core domain-containing protein [Victivallis sp. Marseille-Q1083]